MTIPGLAGGAVGTKYDWNLTYPASKSLNGRNISAPLGKVVGGSTKLNRMVYDRGSKSDYDRWAELGNSDWRWESLLPYFKKVTIRCYLLDTESDALYRMRSLHHPPLRSRRRMELSQIPRLTDLRVSSTPLTRHSSGRQPVSPLQRLNTSPGQVCTDTVSQRTLCRQLANST